MVKEYKVCIELYDGFARKTAVNYISGDSDTMPLRIVLLSNGKPVLLTEESVVALNFENSGGARFTRNAVISDYEQAEVLYEVQPGDIVVVGEVTVGVTVTCGGKRLSWHGFKFTVSGSLSEDQTEPPAGAIRGPSFFAMSVDESGELVMLTNNDVVMPINVNEDGHLIYSFE